MNGILLHEPTTLTLIATDNCTSACYNCCFQCSPRKQNRLSVGEMKSYIEQAVGKFPTIRVLVLTGGECFTYGDALAGVISYAKKTYGMVVRIVTNAYWAKKEEQAYNRLKVYVDAGLDEINISTGDDHLEFVPYERIVNAVKASVKLGLSPLVNVESRNDRLFTSNEFLKSDELKQYINAKKLHVTNGIWVSFKKDTKQQRNNISSFTFNHGRCKNLFNSITIDYTKRMLACCGLTAKYIKYLDLGNTQKYNLRKLYDKQICDFMKIWLFTDGPFFIMEFLSKYHPIDMQYCKGLHDCQLCAIIFNNRAFMETLKKHYREVYSNVILKYQIINY